MGETAALVLVSYAGVTKVAAIGGEIKDPGRNLPGGILASLAIGATLYAIIVATMIAVIPPGSFFDSSGHVIEDPVRVFAYEVAGHNVAILAAIIAILTIVVVSVLFIFFDRNQSNFIPLLTLITVASIRLMPSVNTVTSSITRLKYLSPAFANAWSGTIIKSYAGEFCQ